MSADRPGPPFSAFLRRLGVRPLSSWDIDRQTACRRAIDELARLGWLANGGQGPVPHVPDLGPMALADQLTVLAREAAAATAAPPSQPTAVEAVLARLTEELSVRLE